MFCNKTLTSFRACVPRHVSTLDLWQSHRSEQQLFDEPFAWRLIVPRQGSLKLKRKQSTVKVGSSELKQKNPQSEQNSPGSGGSMFCPGLGSV